MLVKELPTSSKIIVLSTNTVIRAAESISMYESDKIAATVTQTLTNLQELSRTRLTMQDCAKMWQF